MSTIKSELRKRCKTHRQNHNRSSACEEAFFKSRFYNEYDTILTYVAFGSEAETSALIKEALKDNKAVFVPKIFGDEMEFYRVYDTDGLIKGSFGIPEPEDGEVYSGQKAVCVAPGLAFDKNGNRLGYGRGYYDKFLSNHPSVLKIGFCSGCCFFEEIPCEKTDVKMDFIFVDDTLIGI